MDRGASWATVHGVTKNWVLAAEGSERQLSQRASELVQKASQSLWAWERPQVAPPLGNQMRHC